MVYELALASPSHTYCLSDFGLFVETTTFSNQNKHIDGINNKLCDGKITE